MAYINKCLVITKYIILIIKRIIIDRIIKKDFNNKLQ